MTCRPPVAKPLLKEETLLRLTYILLSLPMGRYYFTFTTSRWDESPNRPEVVRIVSCLGVTLGTTLGLIESGTFTPGTLFTKRTDVLPWDLVKSRSREIGCHIDSVALKFANHLGSSAAEVSVKFWSYWKSLSPRVSDFTRSYGLSSVCLVNRDPAFNLLGLLLCS